VQELQLCPSYCPRSLIDQLPDFMYSKTNEISFNTNLLFDVILTVHRR